MVSVRLSYVYTFPLPWLEVEVKTKESPKSSAVNCVITQLQGKGEVLLLTDGIRLCGVDGPS